METKLTRGIRNNNPGNLRKGSKWKGLRDFHVDKEFCEFKSMQYGIRALLMTLRTYVTKHGLHTVPEIIERYAPRTENATDVYINKVADNLTVTLENLGCTSEDGYTYKFESMDFIVPTDALFSLCSSICWMESQYRLSYKMFADAHMVM